MGTRCLFAILVLLILSRTENCQEFIDKVYNISPGESSTGLPYKTIYARSAISCGMECSRSPYCVAVSVVESGQDSDRAICGLHNISNAMDRVPMANSTMFSIGMDMSFVSFYIIIQTLD